MAKPNHHKSLIELLSSDFADYLASRDFYELSSAKNFKEAVIQSLSHLSDRQLFSLCYMTMRAQLLYDVQPLLSDSQNPKLSTILYLEAAMRFQYQPRMKNAPEPMCALNALVYESNAISNHPDILKVCAARICSKWRNVDAIEEVTKNLKAQKIDSYFKDFSFREKSFAGLVKLQNYFSENVSAEKPRGYSPGA